MYAAIAAAVDHPNEVRGQRTVAVPCEVDGGSEIGPMCFGKGRFDGMLDLFPNPFDRPKE